MFHVFAIDAHSYCHFRSHIVRTLGATAVRPPFAANYSFDIRPMRDTCICDAANCSIRMRALWFYPWNWCSRCGWRRQRLRSIHHWRTSSKHLIASRRWIRLIDTMWRCPVSDCANGLACAQRIACHCGTFLNRFDVTTHANNHRSVCKRTYGVDSHQSRIGLGTVLLIAFDAMAHGIDDRMCCNKGKLVSEWE